MLIKPRTTTVPIYQGDDLEHLAELRMAANQAGRTAEGAPLRAGDERPGQAERDAYDAFVEEAAERAVIVRLTALGRTKWADLVAAHKPRTTITEGRVVPVDEDADYGVNVESFPAALLTVAITEPAEVVEDVAGFLDMISEGDFERLWVTAYGLNRAPGGDPKETAFSTASLSWAEN